MIWKEKEKQGREEEGGRTRLRNLLTGKRSDREKEKEKEKCGTNMCLLNGITSTTETENPTTPVSTTTTTKEKRRWSFRRSSASRELNLAEFGVTASSVTVQNDQNAENDQRKHDPDSNGLSTRCVEEAAAIKIQSVFRSYLVRDI